MATMGANQGSFWPPKQKWYQYMWSKKLVQNFSFWPTLIAAENKGFANYLTHHLPTPQWDFKISTCGCSNRAEISLTYLPLESSFWGQIGVELKFHPIGAHYRCDGRIRAAQ